MSVPVVRRPSVAPLPRTRMFHATAGLCEPRVPFVTVCCLPWRRIKLHHMDRLDESTLGKATTYRDRYDPGVLLPLPRAVQTAELIAAGVDYLGPIASRRCFEPAAQPRVAAEELYSAGAAVLVVSHEPAISTLGAFLMGRPSFPQFRTGQCCAIEDGKPTFTARPDLNQVQALFVD